MLKPKTEGDSPPFSSLNILDVLNGEIKDTRKSEAAPKPNPIRLDFDATEHNDSRADVSVETQTVNILHSTRKEPNGNYVSLKVQSFEHCFSIDNSLRNSPPPPSDDEDFNLADGDGSRAHPANIICTRPEYYTLPSLDELTPDEEGRCFVKGFTIGTTGFFLCVNMLLQSFCRS